MFDAIWPWAVENAVAIGLLAGLVAIVEFSLKPFRAFFGLFKKPPKLDLSEDTIGKLKADAPEHGPKLTVPEFIRIRRELKEELQSELDAAEQEDKAQLLARITELETQIANPEQALTEAQTRIAELETLLEREGNEIGADRIAEAIAALEKGDYSIADDLFAEIEARAQPDVERAARAAYGRGEAAEAEIRWQDAFEHYRRAAQLDASFASLYKAREYAWRTGDLKTAYRFGEDLIEFSNAEGTEEQKATALNEHALTIVSQGHYEEAERLYRQALEIDRATIGEGHPSYATRLNNLALVMEAQGRYEEAEGLYRQALEIDRATIGEGHPDYAIRLNNLALAVEAQGREEEAEGLFRQALEIAEKALGRDHPNTETFRRNLDNLLRKKDSDGDP